LTGHVGLDDLVQGLQGDEDVGVLHHVGRLFCENWTDFDES
jgi:hypothetical protein